MAVEAGYTKGGAGGKGLSAFTYDIEFHVITDNGEKKNLSKYVNSVSLTLSIVKIIPIVSINLSMEITLLSEIVKKMWYGELSVKTRRNISNTTPITPLFKFKLIPPEMSQVMSLQRQPEINKSRHDNTNATLSFLCAKTAKLLRSYVDYIMDYEITKNDTKLSKFICEIFSQANKEGLDLVFHKPDNDRVYEQISVPRSWFINNIIHLQQHYGLYESGLMMYSDGTTFYIVNIANRAKVIADKVVDCSKKDDDKRSEYTKVSPSRVDKAIFIYSSVAENVQKVISEDVLQGVYRIDMPITTGSEWYELKNVFPDKYTIVIEDEKYLYTLKDKNTSDLLNIHTLFPPSSKNIKNHMLADDLRVTVNREETIPYVDNILQMSAFNASGMKVTVVSPLAAEHFYPGFTYRFLPTTKHYEKLGVRYLSNEVVYNFVRRGASWQAGVEVFLVNPSIIEN